MATARFPLLVGPLPLVLALLCTPAHAGDTPAASPPERHLTPLARAQARYLVLCLDGVGYDLVEEMYRRGQLRHFHAPVPLIAPFPTLTNLGLVEILAPLGAPPARGYEDYFFGPAANKMEGGFFHRFHRKSFIEGSFRQIFHYHPSPLAMTFEYGVPVLGPWVASRLTLNRIKREFLKSREPVFLAYLDSTDPAAHLGGRWTLRDVLHQVDLLAGEFQHHARVPVEVVLFSDHGNAFGKWHKVDLSGGLERTGLRVEDRLRDERSVVIPQYGLIGAAVLYTQPGREAAVAEILQPTPGVDLVAYRAVEAVHILGEKGRARLLRRGATFRYDTQAGDPLELLPLVEHLRAQGRADTEGFIHEDDWFRATANHIYPDPVRRLWYAFEGLVAHSASVVVSLKDGYYAGSGLLQFLSGFQLRATHGNLRRTQSLGFAMSTSGTLLAPPAPLVPSPESLPGLAFGIEGSAVEGSKAETLYALPARDLWGRLTRQREQAWTRLRLPPRRCLTVGGVSRGESPAPEPLRIP